MGAVCPHNASTPETATQLSRTRDTSVDQGDCVETQSPSPPGARGGETQSPSPPGARGGETQSPSPPGARGGETQSPSPPGPEEGRHRAPLHRGQRRGDTEPLSTGGQRRGDAEPLSTGGQRRGDTELLSTGPPGARGGGTQSSSPPGPRGGGTQSSSPPGLRGPEEGGSVQEEEGRVIIELVSSPRSGRWFPPWNDDAESWQQRSEVSYLGYLPCSDNASDDRSLVAFDQQPAKRTSSKTGLLIGQSHLGCGGGEVADDKESPALGWTGTQSKHIVFCNCSQKRDGYTVTGSMETARYHQARQSEDSLVPSSDAGLGQLWKDNT
ncbi:unnamed protein product [Arctogadus glacialis]